MLAPTSAYASACDNDVIIPINITPGNLCWDYKGAATTFVGQFLRGQNVEVQMKGQTTEFDPLTNKDTVSWEARMPFADGLNGFVAGPEANDVMTFQTPATGIYRIGFYPCAMWGGNGQVRICAK